VHRAKEDVVRQVHTSHGMRYFIFTVWIVSDDPDRGRTWDRRVWRCLGRTDEPHHEHLKEYVVLQIRTSYRRPLRVEFGPIGLSKVQA
jgi:hypothetical protein